MNKALITGDTGFVGKHLRTLLMTSKWDVHGFSKRYDDDLLDYERVRTVVDEIRPTHIFHLAAQAYVPESSTNPVRAFDVNTIGSVNLLEAVRQTGVKTRILLAGTSEEYGHTTDKVTTENTLPNPQSPYAISKLAMDHMGRLYAKSYGMPVVITRAFNHTGPGRGEMYAESAFARQIVECELGMRDIVQHGNLESMRNYTDVRDVVRAYVRAIDLPSGVYNICSDQNVSMQDVMDLLVKGAKTKIKTEVNPALYRPSDFSFNPPSCDRFHKLTSWRPEIPLEETMTDILRYWRKRLR